MARPDILLASQGPGTLKNMDNKEPISATKDPSSSPTWCSLMWSYYYVGPDGDFRPCCRFNLNEVPEELKLSESSTLTDYFRSPFLEDMRAKMLSGEKISGCQKCYEEEAAGHSPSYRQISNRQSHINFDLKLDHPQIRFLELSYSNLCNIQCRTCTPYFSTAWKRQWQHLQRLGAVGQDRQCLEETSFPGRKTIDIEKLSPHLLDLRQIKFTGGEPLLIPENRELLKKLVSLGIAKNVRLNYSTNLTIEPDDELIDLWSQFQHIEIAASLDGIGPVIEYVRYPSPWEKVQKVLQKIMRLSHRVSLDCGLRSAVSIYNIYSLPETMTWWKEQVDANFVRPFDQNSWLNPSQIYRPLYLSIKVLPTKYKRMVAEKFESYFDEPYLQRFLDQMVSVMHSTDDSHLIPQFQKYTVELDKIRDQSFTDVCPHFADLLKL
ncbi:MAG: twitch domain-containing radical SAM protein [Bdellovibrionales bacterium]|nr:twitch domain-containing radical SAM protein [Bdellovibrionales bacterium]